MQRVKPRCHVSRDVCATRLGDVPPVGPTGGMPASAAQRGSATAAAAQHATAADAAERRESRVASRCAAAGVAAARPQHQAAQADGLVRYNISGTTPCGGNGRTRCASTSSSSSRLRPDGASRGGGHSLTVEHVERRVSVKHVHDAKVVGRVLLAVLENLQYPSGHGIPTRHEGRWSCAPLTVLQTPASSHAHMARTHARTHTQAYARTHAHARTCTHGRSRRGGPAG